MVVDHAVSTGSLPKSSVVESTVRKGYQLARQFGRKLQHLPPPPPPLPPNKPRTYPYFDENGVRHHSTTPPPPIVRRSSTLTHLPANTSRGVYVLPHFIDTPVDPMNGMANNNSRTSKRPKNIGSDLLHEHENRLLWNIMGKGAYSLCAAVCQLLATHPSPSQWTLQCSGVCVLVKDYTKRAYFLRIYDLYKRIMVWEQQLYDEFRVTNCAGILLTFEGDTCLYGLNFSDATEANTFKAHIDRRYEKEMADKRGAMTRGPSAMPMTGHTQNNVVPHVGPQPTYGQENSGGGGRWKKGKKEKKKKISKTDISLPSNFEHRVHLGWDQDSGISHQASSVAAENDPSVREILKAIGIDAVGDMSNGDVRKTIHAFAEQYGGLNQLKEKIAQEQKVPQESIPTSWDTPPRRSQPSRPPPVAYNQHSAPPPPPQQQQPRPVVKNHHAPPPPPPPPPREQQVYNPPPREQQMYNPPAPRQQAPPARPLPNPPQQSNPSPPQSSWSSRPGGVPPPPPPPPAPVMAGGGGGAPPPPAPPPPPPPPIAAIQAAPQGGGGMSDVMAGIRGAGGTAQLKPVDKSQSKPPPVPDSRQTLLSEIQTGRNLRHVDPADRKSGGSPQPTEEDGIIGALRRALDQRRGAMVSSDEEEESDNDNDWDD